MLDESEINAEISRLEYEESSYPNYGKLAILYTIKNQMSPKYESGYSAAQAPLSTPVRADSDFLRAVSTKDANSAWLIMDDLMDTLSVTNPRVYDSVMHKIDAI